MQDYTDVDLFSWKILNRNFLVIVIYCNIYDDTAIEMTAK